MLAGKITVEQWLKDGDAARDKWLEGILFAPAEGMETLARLETSLLVGQIYRDVTDADIPL